MKRVVASGLLGLLGLIVGCSPQPYGQIQVTTSIESPDTSAMLLPPGTGAEIYVSVRCDNARLEDVVRKIAATAHVPVRWAISPDNSFCTASLTNVNPVAAISLILESCNFALHETTNGWLITEGKK